MTRPRRDYTNSCCWRMSITCALYQWVIIQKHSMKQQRIDLGWTWTKNSTSLPGGVRPMRSSPCKDSEAVPYAEQSWRHSARAVVRNKGFQNFAPMIYGTPNIMRLAVDLHENLVQLLLPIGVGAEILDAVPADLSGEHRAKRIHQKRIDSWLISMPRLCSRSSTFRSESGNRTYIITARRMISGLVRKYLNGSRFVILERYKAAPPGSIRIPLTLPY